MAFKWYYAHDENKIGPFSPKQLKDLADTGTILLSDTIWKEGVEKGVLASRVKNLFPLTVSDTPQIINDAFLATVALSTLPPSPDSQSTASAVKTESSPLSGNAESLRAEKSDVESALMAVAVPDHPSPVVVAENTASTPREQAAAIPVQSKSQQRPANKGRVVALRGADIVSQDGKTAKYRRKCLTCGQKDSACQTLTITNKLMKANYFCPKCRKRREVAIQCYLQ